MSELDPAEAGFAEVVVAYEQAGRELGKLLDVEAGLADALLGARYRQAAGELGSALDVEAGLADLLESREPLLVAPSEPVWARAVAEACWDLHWFPDEALQFEVSGQFEEVLRAIWLHIERLSALGKRLRSLLLADELLRPGQVAAMMARNSLGKGSDNLEVLAARLGQRTVTAEAASSIVHDSVRGVIEARADLLHVTGSVGREAGYDGLLGDLRLAADQIRKLEPIVLRLFDTTDDVVEVYG